MFIYGDTFTLYRLDENDEVLKNRSMRESMIYIQKTCGRVATRNPVHLDASENVSLYCNHNETIKVLMCRDETYINPT